jgi:hypothetical protein
MFVTAWVSGSNAMMPQTRKRRAIAKQKRHRRNAREEDDDDIALPDCAFNPGIVAG